ncbi:MAG: ATP-binding protein [Caldilineaceae bacterium]
MGTIRISSETLLTIVNDILDFSKIEAGRMDMEAHPFRLRDCVENSLDLLSEQAWKQGLELSALIEADVPPVIIADAGRLQQILVNLLSNAVKFTEAGEVVLTVARDTPAQDDADERVRLHFTVRDTGIGIAPDKLDSLFQPFSQVDSSTTRRFRGRDWGWSSASDSAASWVATSGWTACRLRLHGPFHDPGDGGGCCLPRRGGQPGAPGLAYWWWMTTPPAAHSRLMLAGWRSRRNQRRRPCARALSG